MSLATHSENTYTKYWLKQLSVEEQEALEALYFSDSEAFDALLAAKQQLLDDYCRQQLTVTERQTLEAHFQVCADCLMDVQLLQGLLAQTAETKSAVVPNANQENAPSAWWRWFWPASSEPAWGRLAFTAVSLLLCLGIGSWLYSRSGGQLGGASEYVLALMPAAQAAAVRDDAATAIVPVMIDSSVAAVRLQLALPVLSGLRCRIEIKELESKKIIWQQIETLSGTTHEVLIPKNILPAGDYRLSLYEAATSVQENELAIYRFDIRDK